MSNIFIPKRNMQRHLTGGAKTPVVQDAPIDLLMTSSTYNPSETGLGTQRSDTVSTILSFFA